MAMLSATSPLTFPAHLQHAIVNDTAFPQNISSAPPAVRRTSWISRSESPMPVSMSAGADPSRNTFSSKTFIPGSGVTPEGIDIGPQRRQSSIYYIKDSDEQAHRLRPPQSAPLTAPSNWSVFETAPSRIGSISNARDSLRSSSSLSNHTSRLSRRVSQPTAALLSLPSEEEEDWTIRAESIITLPSPQKDPSAVRQSLRDSKHLQIQTHIQTRINETPPISAPVILPSHRDSVQLSSSRPSSRQSSIPPSPPSIQSRPTTPAPALLFALASDNADEVQRVLESNSQNNTVKSGSEQPQVGANDTIGPNAQSALEFTLTNEALKNKLDIVKVLLEHGADPAKSGFASKNQDGGPQSTMKMDDATRYYISRANAQLTRRTAALMQRSVFAPLARARYRLIGQERALDQLFRMLSMHSEKISSNPVVVFLCGPSGHGKTLLAHQFGTLLDIPIHTINMTTLKSASDLWRSYSISSNDESTPCTLVEFLANNEGKRCVVVLDEIEKTADLKALWTLLVPWELGRCTFEANSRTIDVRNVIWVGTSNVGQDLIFGHHQSRTNQEAAMSREEYAELMGILRTRVSDELGASILSRVSAILPFVPFTCEEKKAMASEFLQHQSISAGLEEMLDWEKKEKIVEDSVKEYVPSEGARSLYRAVSDLLRFPEQATALPAQEPDTTKDNAQQIVNSVPKSTVALAVIVAVFGAFFLVFFIAWKLRARRRRRNGVLSLDGSVESNYNGQNDEKHDLESARNIEKPEKALGGSEVTPYLGSGGWVPQIRTYHGVPIKQLPKDLQASIEDRKFKKGGYTFEPSVQTPPPAYVVTNEGSERESSLGRPITPPSIPLPPTPPEAAATSSVPPPTPPASKTLLKIPKTTASRFSADTPILSPGSAADPMPSPIRNESFRQQQQLHPPAQPGFKPQQLKKTELPLPRVMTVIGTFEPAQNDELPISVSEMVRMLEEYRDGWCLVEHMDAKDGNSQGVVPRQGIHLDDLDIITDLSFMHSFCLVERQTVIPASSPSHRSKFSSTTGSRI
ncbi:hypothetical protein D9758_000958 [Tetrapyrgos nigripes]|uniref:AAA+ ATPase domain-containing protein n=1 Tax=Tetrapyrgos nigripes TaxID=182062 RepID=A0A8H5GZA7_9AGAR|nr:hypothetical protein D9758_000958 [Tetrapyrgos nigripes]